MRRSQPHRAPAPAALVPMLSASLPRACHCLVASASGSTWNVTVVKTANRRCMSSRAKQRFQRALQSKFESVRSLFWFVLKVFFCTVPSGIVLILIKFIFIVPKSWQLVVFWTCRILPKGHRLDEKIPLRSRESASFFSEWTRCDIDYWHTLFRILFLEYRTCTILAQFRIGVVWVQFTPNLPCGIFLVMKHETNPWYVGFFSKKGSKLRPSGQAPKKHNKKRKEGALEIW